ncbi:lipopolysaccharide biosynthesis protein [Cupriavidus sp. AcVe19-6a]|uniref:lipopolysaccharide biosynthesis protein n=1 Tax=Cupriavidus sp. AcVe19-6a TaxID=2821358 RepID=UPI001AE29031|nr:hypothetical protein [Cupriavidus sp. AcVe19-6a]MBP0639835.1 hypothetical protein [Cupriavidus sp. AcVe19-6a]
MLQRLLNIALRACTLGSKFLLFFFLARYLSPAEVGQFGLLVGAIGYLLLLIGFDFYTFSTRELLGRPFDRWAALIKDQFVFFALCYLIFLPLSYLVLWANNVLPKALWGWLLALLVLEHLAQEMNRLLISMSRPLWAGLTLFFRGGMWSLLAIVWLQLFSNSRTLSTVLFAWSLGVSSSLVIAALPFLKLNWSSVRLPVDWRWLWKGTMVAAPLLVATLALKVPFAFDRFLVNFVASPDVVGVYVFYAGITNAILALIDAGVIAFTLPALIRSVTDGGFAEQMSRFSKAIFTSTILVALLATLIVKPVLLLIGREIYVEHISIFYVLLATISIFCLGLIPHYGLYALRCDRWLIIGNICGAVIFLSIGYPFCRWLGALGVPCSMFFAFAVLGVLKVVLFWRARMSNIYQTVKDVEYV